MRERKRCTIFLIKEEKEEEEARVVSTSSACVSQSVGAQEIALTHANTRWFTRNTKGEEGKNLYICKKEKRRRSLRVLYSFSDQYRFEFVHLLLFEKNNLHLTKNSINQSMMKEKTIVYFDRFCHQKFFILVCIYTMKSIRYLLMT